MRGRLHLNPKEGNRQTDGELELGDLHDPVRRARNGHSNQALLSDVEKLVDRHPIQKQGEHIVDAEPNGPTDYNKFFAR